MEQVRSSPQQYEKFCIKDERLFKQISIGHLLPIRWVLVIPRESRQALLSQCHSDPTSGHCGVHRTFHRIRAQAYWPKMQKEVISYVKKCEVCLPTKMPRTKPAGLVGSKETVSEPFEILSTDLIGHLPRSTQGTSL